MPEKKPFNRKILYVAVAGAIALAVVPFLGKEADTPAKPLALSLTGQDGSAKTEVVSLEAKDGQLLVKSDQAPLEILPPKALVYGADGERLRNLPSDQLLLRFREGSHLASAAGMEDRVDSVDEYLSGIAGQKVSYQGSLDDGLHVFRVAVSGTTVGLREVVDKLKRVGDIQLIESDTRMLVSSLPAGVLPNDSAFAQQWALQAPGSAAVGANAPKGWETTTGRDAVIAIVDTGVTHHSEIADKTLPGYDFVSNALYGNDGDGRDADAADPGDWVSYDESVDPASPFFGCPAHDSSWHGTHVAGIAAATGNNGTGVAGVDWGARILPVRALGKCGGYASDVAAAVMWAAGVPLYRTPVNPTPASVINLSISGAGPCPSSLQRAITLARGRGAVVVVAAGNGNTDASSVAPANCAGVIVVGATGKSGKRSFYSNFGRRITLSAPGGDSNVDATDGTILSLGNSGTTTPGGDAYAYQQGTSMAAPLASGAITLAMAANPRLSPGEAADAVIKKVAPFPVGSDCRPETCGAGLLDIGALVGKAAQMRPDMVVSRVGLSGGLFLPGMEIAAKAMISNIGSIGTKKSDATVKVYLSSVHDSIQGGQLLAELPFPALDLDSNESFSGWFRRMLIPRTTENGTYYLVFSANETKEFEEENYENNVFSSAALIVERPSLRLEVKQVANVAPTDVRIMLASDNPKLLALMGGKNWQLTWNIPESVYVKKKDRRQAVITIAEPVRDLPVSVTLRNDILDQTYTVSGTITAEEPAPYQIDVVAARKSNPYDRAPLAVKFQPHISGGHPMDRPAAIEWEIGGESGQHSSRATPVFTLPAGEHDVKVTVTSKLGKKATQVERIVVNPNQSPECSIATSNNVTRKSLTFIADCIDPDGVVKAYEWYINGMRVAGGRIYTRAYVGEGSWDVEVRASDDAGGVGVSSAQVAF